MRLPKLLPGIVAIILGVATGWIGLNLATDFADLGSVAVAHGDNGIVHALLLVPIGLILVIAGLVMLIRRA